jgi:hypothetical protein
MPYTLSYPYHGMLCEGQRAEFEGIIAPHVKNLPKLVEKLKRPLIITRECCHTVGGLAIYIKNVS